MSIQPTTAARWTSLSQTRQAADHVEAATARGDDSRVRDVFDQFVGQTFFQQMLSAMRKTVEKPAYFDGGRGEEIFQGQLDQVLAERMTEASASEFTDPLFELFMLSRK